MLIYIILVLQIAAVAFAVYTGRARLKRLMNEARNHQNEVLPNDDLPEIDRSILKLLEQRHAMYQSEIMKELGLPKSTVHKALRRLSEAGYVKVQKRGRFNLVILKRPISTASTT